MPVTDDTTRPARSAAPKLDQIQIRCSPEWKERLRQAARDSDREMADIIREAVNEWIAGRPSVDTRGDRPMSYDVATIQTGFHVFEKRLIIAPRNAEGTILLDICPRGTMDVRAFKTAEAAAEFLGVTPATIRRRRARAAADAAE